MYSAERHFVITAHTQLRLMASDEVGEQPPFDIAIGKIKQAAGPVKARAVYRAALLCEDVFKRCSSATDMKFRAALARLNSLVGLYADGLFEIDPEFKSVLNGDSPQATQAAVQASLPETPTAHLKAANQNAAAVLRPLLRLVKDDSQADALAFISGYSQSNTSAKARHADVRFDNLMRQVTNYTLSAARAQAKNISISYAADFDTINTSIAPDIQKLLQAACLDIVRTGLIVTGDLVSSINRSWQISITGETRAQDLVITLGWRGQAMSGISEKGRDALQHLSGKMTTREKQSEPGNKAGPDAQMMIFTCPQKMVGKTAEKTLPAQGKILRTHAGKS